MPWKYSQTTGQLIYNGNVLSKGYSGNGAGKNNPSMENLRDVGPVPRGWYKIGRPRESATTGPFVMDLAPINHNAHGRTALQIHGEKSRSPTGSASTGCIILSPKSVREKIWNSGDLQLEVVP